MRICVRKEAIVESVGEAGAARLLEQCRAFQTVPEIEALRRRERPEVEMVDKNQIPVCVCVCVRARMYLYYAHTHTH